MTQQVDVYKLIVEVEGAGTIGQMEEGLKNLKKELKKTDISTVAFADIQSAIADTEQKLGGLGQSVKQSGDKITNTYKKAAVGIVSGFQAAAGAMAIFTGGSEKSVQALIKLQALMALKDSVTGLIEARKGFSELSTIIGQKLTRAFSSAAASARALGAALGVGLILAALSLIIAKWDDIKEAISNVSKEQRKLLVDAEKLAVAEKERLEALKSSENILKLSGKTEREILKDQLKGTIAVFESNKQRLKAQEIILEAQIEAEKRNKEILKGLLSLISIPIELITRQIDFIGKALGKDFGLSTKWKESIAKLVFNPEDVKKEGQAALKAIRQEQKNLLNDRAGFVLRINELDKKAADDLKTRNEQAAKEAAERAQKLREAQYNEYLAAVKREEDLESARKLREKTNADELKTEREAQTSWLKQDYAQRQLDLYESYQQGLINQEQFNLQSLELEAERLSAEIAMKQFNGESTLELQNELAKLEIDITKNKNDQILKSEQDLHNAKWSLAQAGANALVQLGEFVNAQIGKQTAFAKAAALVQIGIDTARAYVDGLRIAQEGAKATGPAAPFAFPIFYATQVGAILSAVNKAKSLLGGGGGSSNSPSFSSSGVNAPVVNTSPLRTQQLNNITGDQRVHVLVKDINDGQRTVRVIDSNSFVV